MEVGAILPIEPPASCSDHDRHQLSRSVFSIEPDCDHDAAAGPGDLVRAGSNYFPHFRVIAVHAPALAIAAE